MHLKAYFTLKYIDMLENNLNKFIKLYTAWKTIYYIPLLEQNLMVIWELNCWLNI